MSGFDDATQRQHDAARPGVSTWLSANAGSGKTRVLTDRAARLLLDGVDPQEILCLTYTKAAASEMQNRLFGRLGAWAMLEDAPLLEELRRIGVSHPPPLDQARTLFARAIETPGGLKIQTIHAFCASILRRFPLEAGVPPNFTEIDERASELLIREVISELALGPKAPALSAAGRYLSQNGYEELAQEVLATKDAFSQALNRDQIWEILGLKVGFDEAEITATAFTGEEPDLVIRLAHALSTGTKTDQSNAKKLTPLLNRDLSLADLPLLESVFLFGSGAKTPFCAKIGSFPTKSTQAAFGANLDDLNAFMSRVEEARKTRLSLEAAHRSAALHDFASVFLPAYQTAKSARGWLDFDDLIRRTRDLLTKRESAAWVLYRLDGGLSHILVDEAQDTSPAQWQVIAKLAEEMTSGEGAQDGAARTIFVVGDKKQSIYSFQGADPKEFDRMARHFHSQLAQSGGLNLSELVYSFRSSAAVLASVDAAYEGDRDDAQRHRAFFDALPGRVDLWPLVEPAEKSDPEHWYDPVDLEGENHHSVQLAAKVAEFIQDSIANETLPLADGTRRAIHAGDFLILVQGRQTGLFHNIIHACKTAGLPVAGADRLRLTSELAVKDLLSLLAFLALPEDDLALAEALRSPLLGLSERDLFHLAHGRKGYLWAALRERREEEVFASVYAQIDVLLGQADFLRPYELLEKILTELGGRARLIARLGAEVEDGIDLLLSQALSYEQSETPSLTGFVSWCKSGEAIIKRQPDQAGRQIRVMTVHGSKGLEAPIVILPDTLKAPDDVRGEIFETDDGVALWRKGGKDADPPILAQAHERARAAAAAEKQRLLYVAMTRAEKWLVVCGSGKPLRSGTWHENVRNALNTVGAVAWDMPTGEGLRLSHGDWGAGPVVDTDTNSLAPPELPKWVFENPEPVARPEPPLSPSNLGGPKALAGEGKDPEEAMAYGSHLHLLLEHLPGQSPDQAAILARSLLPDLEEEARDQVLANALTIVDDPTLQEIFGSNSLAEVPFTATPKALGGRNLHGTIDRLVLTETGVMAVDFKSNTVVPKNAQDVPEGILRQMGAYAAALSDIYPDREIRLAILWTEKGSLMPLPHDLVMSVLANTPLT